MILYGMILYDMISHDKERMMEISAVKLRNSFQINYVNTNNLFVNRNALCLIETEHGIDIGHVYRCRKNQNNRYSIGCSRSMVSL